MVQKIFLLYKPSIICDRKSGQQQHYSVDEQDFHARIIQIFQPYSLRRHYHICLKATLWNTLQRDPKPRDMNTKSRRRLYVNRNPNGGEWYEHYESRCGKSSEQAKSRYEYDRISRQ